MSDPDRTRPVLAESVAELSRCITTHTPCGVVLLGAPGAGKSTLAAELAERLGNGTAVVSYAAHRAELSGDTADVAVDAKAIEVSLDRLADRRTAGTTTIVDGTHRSRTGGPLYAPIADGEIRTLAADATAPALRGHRRELIAVARRFWFTPGWPRAVWIRCVDGAG